MANSRGGGSEAVGLGTLGLEDIRRDNNDGEEARKDNKRDNEGGKKKMGGSGNAVYDELEYLT